MDYNSKSIKAESFRCTSRPNLSEDGSQKSCECYENWISSDKKKTTYFKEPFLTVPSLK